MTRDPDHRSTEQDEGTPHHDDASGGWGSLAGVSRVLAGQRPPLGAARTLMRQNKPGGHMCTSCAWAKPPDPHPFEFCENGAKATLWELTRDRATPELLAGHTLAELRGWSDHDLEMTGRLTHPMRYDAASDRYLPCAWEEAFAAIGRQLRAIDPKAAVFYASGRAGLETSYLYALFARLYGHNNLPDSSNMCHETTSVGLKEVIGSPVGTCVLRDFESCDMILFLGQNTGSNSPRFLHPLKAAVERGCRVFTFNPVRERGLIEFVDPQNPLQMTVGSSTPISERYLQVRPGGDIAALTGLCKRVLERDAAHGGIVDRAFVEAHTDRFEAFAARMAETSWEEVERASGLRRADLEHVADAYCEASRVIGIYGMGLTQHVHGSQSIAMLVNLLLLRGNVGREGAGISPVRGHSNVQGQRTVGISEKPELVPLDRLAEMFVFEPPREEGHTTVNAVRGILDGSVRAFVGLGGNFARAIPDVSRVDPAWAGLDLTVQIATKLNRTHLLPGREAYLLPCLARSEEDRQATGPQAVTMEDSLSHVHGSIGRRPPASEHLRSELAIVAGMAEATLEPNPNVRWDEWTGDYALVRGLIARTYPDEFHDFDARKFTPGGFYRGNAARERRWKTDTGRAHFTAPEVTMSLGQEPGEGAYTLITLRSNDQFNTTVYGFSDRMRGLEGSRMIVMMNPREIEREGLREGQVVALVGAAEDDGPPRRVDGLAVTPYDLPDGCVAAYYPEANPLVPLDQHDLMSRTPAYKGALVRIDA